MKWVLTCVLLHLFYICIKFQLANPQRTYACSGTLQRTGVQERVQAARNALLTPLREAAPTMLTRDHQTAHSSDHVQKDSALAARTHFNGSCRSLHDYISQLVMWHLICFNFWELKILFFSLKINFQKMDTIFNQSFNFYTLLNLNRLFKCFKIYNKIHF